MRRLGFSCGFLVGIILGAFVLVPTLIAQPPVPQGGSQFIPLPDIIVTGVATTLEGPRGDRIALLCTNNSASVHVRVGNGTVMATQGARVHAGKSATFTSTSIITAISEGANVTMSCTSERR